MTFFKNFRNDYISKIYVKENQNNSLNLQKKPKFIGHVPEILLFFSSEKYQTNKTIPDYKTMLALSFR